MLMSNELPVQDRLQERGTTAEYTYITSNYRRQEKKVDVNQKLLLLRQKACDVNTTRVFRH